MLYEKVRPERLGEGLRSLLPGWNLAPDAPVRLLAISENATFLVGDAARRIVVRVYRPGYHREAEMRSELAWVEALSADGAAETARPVPTRTGERLVSFLDGGEPRFAAAFEHLAGAEPAALAELPRWFGRLGEIAARLHAHAERWERPAGFVRKRWDFETILGAGAHWGDWRRAPGLDGEGRAVLERCHARLDGECEAAGDGADRFGLIHGDMRTANLLVDGDRLAVIDFDDCGLSWFGYDFAASVSFIEHEPIVPRLREAWLAGYRRLRPFGEAQAKLLPMLVMLRRMQLTAWIASHAETPTARALGPAYTVGTVRLAADYLKAHPPAS